MICVDTPSPIFWKINIIEPDHENLVRIAYASTNCSDEHAQTLNLTRAFAAHTGYIDEGSDKYLGI